MSIGIWIVVAATMTIGALVSSTLYFRVSARARALESDLRRNREKLQDHLSRATANSIAVSDASSLEALVEARRAEVGELERRLTVLKSSIDAVEEEVEIQSFGFYRTYYAFESASEYQKRLDEIRAEQKRLIKEDQAAQCPTNFVVDGSAARGKKMIREQAKLMLRAFNGECDAAIAKVKYDNVKKLETRIERSFDGINALGESKQVSITKNYLNAKIEEIRLVHEYQEKLQEEKDIQRELKEQMREDAKAQKELDRATAEAERDQRLREEALERARQDLAASTAEQHERLRVAVEKLETELSAAIDRKAKAIARAQLTRSGYVYVISNVGSFGDGVFKIGLTRRFDPLIRVKELGDASVPFPFDVHAVIYSEDAPALENALHREFDGRRVNKVNTRKEYFKVTLDEIRHAVSRHFGIVTFVTRAEAEQYRKTRALEIDSGEQPAARAG